MWALMDSECCSSHVTQILYFVIWLWNNSKRAAAKACVATSCLCRSKATSWRAFNMQSMMTKVLKMIISAKMHYLTENKPNIVLSKSCKNPFNGREI